MAGRKSRHRMFRSAVDRRAVMAASVGQGPPYNAVGKGSANVFFTEFSLPRKAADLEAEAGIEPTYKDLQSSA